mgnify:CR=1 FL=1|tara:strand:+ start:596 stop:931 length:336 start_codon:yes stop_codon:yes gene_type:complete
MTWDIALIIGLSSMSFGLFYLSSVIDERHYAIKLFLLLTGLFNYLGLAATLPKIIAAHESDIGVSIAAELTSITDGIYTGYIWLMVAITTYFLIYWLYEAASSVRLRREND